MIRGIEKLIADNWNTYSIIHFNVEEIQIMMASWQNTEEIFCDTIKVRSDLQLFCCSRLLLWLANSYTNFGILNHLHCQPEPNFAQCFWGNLNYLHKVHNLYTIGTQDANSTGRKILRTVTRCTSYIWRLQQSVPVKYHTYVRSKLNGGQKPPATKCTSYIRLQQGTQATYHTYTRCKLNNFGIWASNFGQQFANFNFVKQF